MSTYSRTQDTAGITEIGLSWWSCQLSASTSNGWYSLDWTIRRLFKSHSSRTCWYRRAHSTQEVDFHFLLIFNCCQSPGWPERNHNSWSLLSTSCANQTATNSTPVVSTHLIIWWTTHCKRHVENFHLKLPDDSWASHHTTHNLHTSIISWLWSKNWRKLQEFCVRPFNPFQSGGYDTSSILRASQRSSYGRRVHPNPEARHFPLIVYNNFIVPIHLSASGRGNQNTWYWRGESCLTMSGINWAAAWVSEINVLVFLKEC